ncbi:MAG: hypothetical protein PHC88_05720 [Terrimicrobiaceae bacterium]|nr:hypothetical protein [Terrimicrobiaceae bacterium]
MTDASAEEPTPLDLPSTTSPEDENREIRRRLETLLAEAISPEESREHDPVMTLLAHSVEPPLTKERRGRERWRFSAGSPLVGWLGDMKTSFEYRPLDVSAGGMQMEVRMPPERGIEAGEHLDLCLPFRIDSEVLNHCDLRWVVPREDGFICGVKLSNRGSGDYGVMFDFSSGLSVAAHSSGRPYRELTELFRWVLDDAIFVKRAMILYLGHLAPLLARLSKVDRVALSLFKRMSLDHTERRIRENIATIEELIQSFGALNGNERLGEFLLRFRSAIRPEINEFSLRRLLRTPESAGYLRSIRLSDRKLATHYNSLVLLAEEFVRPDAV